MSELYHTCPHGRGWGACGECREEEGRCINCGSKDVSWIEGDFPSGVAGPNGEQEILHEEGFKCDACGAVEDRLTLHEARP